MRSGRNIGAFINGAAKFNYRDGVARNPSTNASLPGDEDHAAIIVFPNPTADLQLNLI